MLNISLCSDHRYSQHLAVALKSLLSNTSNSNLIKVWILDAGLAKSDKVNIYNLCHEHKVKVDFIYVPVSDDKSLHISHYVTRATYGRLYLPELLSKDIDQCIYIDSDVVVLDDIFKLNGLNLNNYCLAAVNGSDVQRNASLGIPLDMHYFNAGVTIVNLKEWRKRSIAEKVFKYIRNNADKLECWDQDALNAVLYRDWMQIPLRWNVRTNLFGCKQPWQGVTLQDIKVAINYPALVHFTGPYKPWHYLNDHPFKSYYWKYLNETPWLKYQPPEKEIVKNKFLSKKLIIFGTGNYALQAKKNYKRHGFCLDYAIDNDPVRHGKKWEGIPVYPPEQILKEPSASFIIVVASMYYSEIIDQLYKFGLQYGKDFIRYKHEFELIN